VAALAAGEGRIVGSGVTAQGQEGPAI
jgi:hypothetical protein